MQYIAKTKNETEMQTIFNSWNFELSPFQKTAISAIVDGNSTIIGAHTGCGKTLPAEFAIKYYHGRKKVIYTAPIKALSNEKYEDFTNKFPNISFGIITGDNIINPDADCLVMTTEIFRNTLFKMNMIKEGSIDKDSTLHFEMDIYNELGTIIFDEIHYINDEDRGSVWEESIMMLPNHIPIIGLSATLEKPEKFYSWLEKKGKPVITCGTNKRIVPLTHKSFITFPPSCVKKLSLEDKNILESTDSSSVLKTSGGEFQEKRYSKISKVFKILDKNRIRVDKYYAVNELVKKLKEQEKLPAICFVFSKRQTWEYAKKISFSLFEEGSKIPSIIEQECKKILINKLDNWKEYVELEEFKSLMRCLQKGVGVHHSGIIGVFREMLEKLFHKGYIKLLFATETLGIGINMPTKTVIYTSLMKYSGNKFRWLHPHELQQTSGRAGRRGKDSQGEAYHLLNLYFNRNNLPDNQTMRHILTGKSQSISTKFKVHFNLLLRLIAINNFDFEGFVKNSMLCDEINDRISLLKNDINEAGMRFLEAEEKMKSVQSRRVELEEYLDLETKLNYMKNKDRKKAIIKMELLSSSNSFKNDYCKYSSLITNRNMLKQYNLDLKSIQDYMYIEITRRLTILQQFDFIECDNEKNYSLTERGHIAANIQEIHCLAIADIMQRGVLNNLNTQELVAVLSCFTPVRLSDENKIWSVKEISNCSQTIKNAIESIEARYNYYYDMETREETNFVYSYDIQFDTCELAYRWCFAENEVQCKHIYEEAKYYGIYIGEWIKVVLKINNIAKELEKVCELTNNLKLLESLKKIPDVTLKSVATNQSLYL